MTDIYYYDRDCNHYVFALLTKQKTIYQVKIIFKGGSFHMEEWTQEDLDELLSENKLLKVDKIDWNILENPIKPKQKRGIVKK